MPTFTDLHILAELAGTRSKGSFGEFMERETGYSWDGTLVGKISLMEHYFSSLDRASLGQDSIKKLEAGLLPVLATMEHVGVAVDRTKLKILTKEVREKIDALENQIYVLCGDIFNINSPKQVADVLFVKMKIPTRKKNKTGYSVDNEVLEEIAQEYEIAGMILEYRSLAKLESTYLLTLEKLSQKDGRIHTTYNQIGAATGRMSSIDPNMQNIPTGEGYGREIKSCFVASHFRDDADSSAQSSGGGGQGKNILIVADYSQIELRVLAWLSGDSSLLEAFEKNEDIHARTARFLFPDAGSGDGDDAPTQSQQYRDKSQITSEQRRIAKTVNFGVIYGITGFGLSKTLGTSPWEADGYIKAFYEKYPGVREYYDGILELGRERGYVETAFGRRRAIPSLNDANKMIRSIAEREAINMPIQGTAADMIKYAMIDIDAKIRDKGLQGSMILQVHDELVFDVPIEEESLFREIIRDCMEHVIEAHIHDLSPGVSRSSIPPITVDIGSGENWAKAKG